ncbi:hypothetical protein [Nostoc sp. 'Peltigera membranacea cyanobiont' N6]|uniref:hypothetical protein n=1 Tax=Nostoc sp. 'Peltigera membranacea cyanobiont' N6 TaxID=1261031 RepID=UPI000CF33412|nr:hypothetical protein [Nostoc sp. 'Peltigera membranacea cyanobiont' N6]
MNKRHRYQHSNSFLFKAMKVNATQKPNKGVNAFVTSQHLVKKLLQEYERLVMLSSPSNDELTRIEQILELAVYDTELDNLINQVDEQIASEMGLL